MEPVLIIVGFLAVVVGAIVFGYLARKKRREAMARVAVELGLCFEPDDDRGMDTLHGEISLFREGHSRVARNVITGDKEGCGVDLFDYTFVTGSGKNRTTHNRSVCVLTMPLELPYLFVRPEGFLDKIAGALGFDDIDFESKEFSSRFLVKSSDKKFAYDIVHPQMMEFLMGVGAPPLIEINGRRLACYYKSKIAAPVYAGLFYFAWEMLGKFPNYVVEERKIV